MTAIFDLTPMIMPFVRDCSAPAAVVAARHACIEFYKLTLWQQEQLEPVDLVANQGIYEIEVPPNTVASTVMRAQVQDQRDPLVPMSKDELDAIYNMDWTTLTGLPKYCTQFDPDNICLVPAPDADAPNGLMLLVAVQPTQDAVEIDDAVFERYAEPLAYGARARLVETAGQPYYDPSSAPLLWGRFYGGVSEAKAKRQRDMTRTVLHVQMRPWI